jgi:uncharacterized protein (DUF2267 family)
VDSRQFVATVEDAAGLERESAERAIQATLSTLGERIDRGEASQLAAQLPPEVAPWIATADGAHGFDLDEFLRRVAEREGTDVSTAERHAYAVFAALGQAVSPDELADLAAELPRSYAPLLPAGRHVEILPADRFVERVAERAELTPEQARRATDAVLETLAERIAGGEVEDLIVLLPIQLHEPLRRGREHTGGTPARMSLEDFERRVAEREGVAPAYVRDHIRAVLAVLREAVGDDEFSGVRAQLPHDYDVLLGGARRVRPA